MAADPAASEAPGTSGDPRAPRDVDLLVRGAAELATPRGSASRSGEELDDLLVIPKGAVAVDGGRVVGVGSEGELAARYRPRETLDCGGGTIVPGFVDAHTHPVFATTREAEFEMRTKGASYVEIGRAGGGILSTVRGVRESSKEELLARLLLHLDRFLEAGTTTVEAKSGYGLSVADELKSLEVLAEAAAVHPVEVVPTFLGAHEFPPEYRERRSAYVDLLVEEMLPAVAERELAEFCDVFTEEHVFGVGDSRRVLERARELGLELRLHVDQLTSVGGAELAAELGARSADHLELATETGIAALAAAGVVPVLCPVVPLYLRLAAEVPARRMIEAGLAPAIATDFNPGSCYLQSMPEVVSWAALRLRMTSGECLTAATLNAAASLSRAGELGSIEVGKRADLVVLDLESHLQLAYELGRNPVRAVCAGGRVALVRREGTHRREGRIRA